MPTTAEAIGLPFDEAIRYFREKTRTPSDHWSDVWKEAHARAFMVAGATSDALLSDFQQALQKALSHGTPFAEFRADFDRIVRTHGWEHTGEPGWRARVIYETNLATAYSAGRYAQQTEPETLAAFPFWTYRHSGNRHPRLMHLAWDGLTLKADDPWWDAHYPPNGWHCGCRVSIVSAAGLRRMGKSGPDVAPPLVTRDWVNPKTGETHKVAVGIDPGFDYNPGKAWAAGRAAELPARAPRLRPAGPPLPQPTDAQIDALRRFVARPEGAPHPLGRLDPSIRAALAQDAPAPPLTAALPAASVGQARGLQDSDWLLLPMLVGAPSEAAALPGGVLAAMPSGDAMLAGVLTVRDGQALLGRLRRLSAERLARLLSAGIRLLGGE